MHKKEEKKEEPAAETPAEGTPEDVARNKNSYTGLFLNKKLN